MGLSIKKRHLVNFISRVGKSGSFAAPVVVAGFLTLLSLLFVFAQTLPAHADTTISQSYTSESKLTIGSIVSLRDDSFDTVNAATPANADNIFGVVVNDGESLIKLSSGQENQVQVATDGIVNVLVSDINGEVAKGDHITASPIHGVGMKAASNVKVVGVAQGGLTEERGSTETYTDGDGEEQSVLLGEVPVLINVAYFFDEPEKTLIPAAIQNIANTVAGKPVEPLPIIISAVIFIVTLISVSSMIFSMIRGSIISVGRNPMSQSAVYRNVIQISALVLVILSVAVVSIYMVLTRF